MGNRSAEDMVNTLPKEKRQTIASMRKALLDRGFLEDVEYDSINIEPVLKYSKSELEIVFLRHKWELTAMIPVIDSSRLKDIEVIFKDKSSEFLIKDEEGNQWMKFILPGSQDEVTRFLDLVFPL